MTTPHKAYTLHWIGGKSWRAMLANNLKLARLLSGFTMAQAGKEACVSQSSICRAEKGQRTPHLSVLLRLCIVYGVQLSDLLVIDGSTAPHTPQS